MFRVEKAADPRVHETASRIASRVLWVTRPLLRQGDWDDALRSYYDLGREELESSARPKPSEN